MPKKKGVRTYRAQHNRLTLDFGPARLHDCNNCQQQATNWSFIKEWCPEEELKQEWMKNQWGEYLMPFSNNQGHYVTLCLSCHRSYDRNPGSVFHG